MQFGTALVLIITITHLQYVRGKLRDLKQINEECNYHFVHEDCQEQRIPMILGGETANSEDYRFLVSLQIASQQDSGDLRDVCFQHVCGGTMLTPNIVLTAAHCFKDLIVASGEQPIQPIYVANYPRCRHLNDPGRERLPVDRVFIHPEYDSVIFNADVAILTLLKRFEGPTIDIDFDLPEHKVGSELQVVGYGYIGDEDQSKYAVYPLQQASVQTISMFSCEEMLAGSLDACVSFLNSTSMMCATRPKVDTRDGDSGSPVMIPQTGSCNIVPNSNAKGTLLRTISEVSDVEECCSQCRSQQSCNTFVYCPLPQGCENQGRSGELVAYKQCDLKSQTDVSEPQYWFEGAETDFTSGFLQNRGKWKQVGIVSWGPGTSCKVTSSPDVFVRLSSFKNWINQMSEKYTGLSTIEDRDDRSLIDFEPPGCFAMTILEEQGFEALKTNLSGYNNPLAIAEELCMPSEFHPQKGSSKANRTLTTLLHIAALYWDVEAVEYLLKRVGMDPNTRDNNGEYPLTYTLEGFVVYWLPYDEMFVDTFMALVDAGANVSARFAYGGVQNYTPLHFLAYAGNRHSLVPIILRGGADVHARDSRGYTPIHSAARCDFRLSCDSCNCIGVPYFGYVSVNDDGCDSDFSLYGRKYRYFRADMTIRNIVLFGGEIDAVTNEGYNAIDLAPSDCVNLIAYLESQGLTQTSD